MHILELSYELLKAAVVRQENGTLFISNEDYAKATAGYDLVLRREKGGAGFELRLKERSDDDEQGSRIIMPGANDVPRQFEPGS